MTRFCIHLVRHGEPACSPRSSLSREEYRHWVEAYDAAGIVGEPTEAIKNWIRSCEIRSVFSSSLLRSIQSASSLVPLDYVRSEPVFDEASVAIAPIPFRMSSTAWTSIGRISWLLGAAAREEVAEGKVRARVAASMLVQSAACAETLLVGHGWMIRMIGSALQHQGFNIRGERANGGYWSRSSFEI